MKRPAKIDNLMDLISKKLDKAQDRYVDHALQRIKEREVTFLEVRQVLRGGYHEKRKDDSKKSIKLGIIQFVVRPLIREI